MTAKVVPQAPRTRCYFCGRPKVDMMCHHCGRAICKEHGPTSLPEGRGVENPEFTDLGLGHTAVGEAGIHCKKCVHYVRSYKWMLSLGVAVGVVGLIVLFVGASGEQATAIIMGVLAVAAGIGLAAGGITLQRSRYRQKIIDSRPSLPVIGRFQSVSVTESIHGHITLDASGEYIAQADQPQGKITLAFQFAPRDRERLGTYLTKYELPVSDDIPFHAGFGVLQGSANLQLDDSSACMPGRVNTIALTGSTGGHPFLSGSGTGRDNHWVVRHTYTFSSNGDELGHLPIQVVPSLVQEGAQSSIELILQLAPQADDLSTLAELARIEELSLQAPQSLGKVEIVEPSAIVSSGTQVGEGDDTAFVQTIAWKGISLSSGEQPQRHKSFYVRFENTVEPTTVLNGRLRVRFDGTLSGLDDVTLFYPLGNERERPDVQRHTYVDVDFNLDLGGLRFQEMTSAEERIVREGVVPNHYVVAALTNAFSAEDFYVKRVIENPPRTSKAGAHITNRYWDIAGRFYDGVYPIDFHLVLTGEEVYGGANRSHISKMQTDVSVQGAVTDEEMRTQVDYLKDRLVAIINSTLDELPDMPIEIPPMMEEILVTEEEEEIPDIHVTPPQPPVTTDRVAVLRARLDKLDEALIEGRISEERYEQMRVRIEQELIELTNKA